MEAEDGQRWSEQEHRGGRALPVRDDLACVSEGARPAQRERSITSRISEMPLGGEGDGPAPEHPGHRLPNFTTDAGRPSRPTRPAVALVGRADRGPQRPRSRPRWRRRGRRRSRIERAEGTSPAPLRRGPALLIVAQSSVAIWPRRRWGGDDEYIVIGAAMTVPSKPTTGQLAMPQGSAKETSGGEYPCYSSRGSAKPQCRDDHWHGPANLLDLLRLISRRVVLVFAEEVNAEMGPFGKQRRACADRSRGTRARGRRGGRKKVERGEPFTNEGRDVAERAKNNSPDKAPTGSRRASARGSAQ